MEPGVVPVPAIGSLSPVNRMSLRSSLLAKVIESVEGRDTVLADNMVKLINPCVVHERPRDSVGRL